jgi:LemA protein
MFILIPLAIILLIPVIYVIVQYNGLIAIKNHIRDAWANIDTELKRRYELIPNLVATVKGYAAHEQVVFESVIEARNRCSANHGPVASQADDEKQLVSGLGKLFALSESYPELKADRHFLELQTELINTEDRIQAARRFYNGNVRDYRNKTESFPSNIVAGLFSFPKEDFFEVEPVVRSEVPQARF